MRPGQVDVEEEEQDAEAEDRWVELVVISREPIEEKMAVDLDLGVNEAFSFFPFTTSFQNQTNLGLHEYQVDKQHHKVMLHIFVRKALTSRTLCQSNIANRGRFDLCF